MTGERKSMWVPDETTLREKNTRGVRYFEVTLPTVRQVARNQFNCQRLTGAPLENQPTNEDCFGSVSERCACAYLIITVWLGIYCTVLLPFHI